MFHALNEYCFGSSYQCPDRFQNPQVVHVLNLFDQLQALYHDLHVGVEGHLPLLRFFVQLVHLDQL